MKKEIIIKFMVLSALSVAFTMTSCSSTESLEEKAATISIPVNGESFGDEVESRAETTKADTIKQNLGNGAVMEVYITPDGAAVQTRAANNVADNTPVLVAIYKGSTYYRTLTASISSGKISNVQLPTGESLNLRFYAHADKSSLPTATSDGKITDTNTDLMYGHIDGLTLDSNGNATAGNISNGFSFKHLFTRACIALTTSAGKITALSGLNLTGTPVNYTSAVVNLYNAALSNLTGSNNTQSYTTPTLGNATVTTAYKNFIVNSSVAPKLSFTSITANTVTSTNKSVTLSGALSNGKSYKISVNIKIPTYKVIYNASSGVTGVTSLPSSQTKTVGTNLTLSTAKPSRTDDNFGYTFLGWSKTNGGSTVDFAAGATVSDGSSSLNHKTGDVNLYAVWKQTSKCGSLTPNAFSGIHVIVGQSYTYTISTGWTFTVRIDSASSFTITSNSNSYAPSLTLNNGVLTLTKTNGDLYYACWSIKGLCTNVAYKPAMERCCAVTCGYATNVSVTSLTATDCQ
jgi:uncharacterized repeat protein (TIGR02543 family)